jgi:uncharacterized protein YecE (DUF72 family)
MKMTAIGTFRIGTSGWNYEHWRGRFYPPDLPASRWFEHYSQVFDTVEINNTFYQLPESKTFDHWRRQAPPGFVYAVKANRFLTHMKKLKDSAGPLRRFLTRTRRLHEFLGPILYQLPPGWKRNVERLRDFCAALPDDLMHVFEFRNPDWLAAETFAVLDQCGECLCIHDLIDRHPRRVTGPAAYVRFHGSGQLYGGRYPREQLRRWADWMREVAAAGRQVFAYFNNDAEANAVHDAVALRELLGMPIARAIL